MSKPRYKAQEMFNWSLAPSPLMFFSTGIGVSHTICSCHRAEPFFQLNQSQEELWKRCQVGNCCPSNEESYLRAINQGEKELGKLHTQIPWLPLVRDQTAPLPLCRRNSCGKLPGAVGKNFFLGFFWVLCKEIEFVKLLRCEIIFLPQHR